MTEIAVGDNLITNEAIEYLIRSNRMIKVVRGISARELYLSSQLLSKYIRLNITEQRSSIWLAQRQGRTKNGYDVTEQGLLKMLDMSGTGDFQSNFEALNIIPMSISYEYEPCDILKARETVISRKQKYVKAEGEDFNSIMVGIMQQKGNVHLNIGKPLTSEEIAAAAKCDKNDRYQLIRHAVVVEESTEVGVVGLGSSVKITRNGIECEYKIVGSNEADPFENKISDSSAVGAAIIGKKTGDVVIATTDKGKVIEIKILDVFKA
jgi:hypothetical protein